MSNHSNGGRFPRIGARLHVSHNCTDRVWSTSVMPTFEPTGSALVPGWTVEQSHNARMALTRRLINRLADDFSQPGSVAQRLAGTIENAYSHWAREEAQAVYGSHIDWDVTAEGTVSEQQGKVLYTHSAPRPLLSLSRRGSKL